VADAAIPKLLSIAGSDPSGGAGVQADIKTFSAFRCYGMAAITALTAQNTRGVLRMEPIAPEIVAAQIDAVFADIGVDAVKIGMLATPQIARAVAAALRRAGARNIVLDPVLSASAGAPLGVAGLAQAILDAALPLAALVTPNLAEAAILTGTPPARSLEEMAAQARLLVAGGARAALVKGGHLEGAPSDVLCAEGVIATIPGARVATRNTHGTGCALSSAIAAGLARGRALGPAIEEAKAWLTQALAAGAALDLGAGAGPPHLFWALWRGA
jgi:hydroxymethylpyrimidine/phosphomethylpyrimidine kinase